MMCRVKRPEIVCVSNMGMQALMRPVSMLMEVQLGGRAP